MRIVLMLSAPVCACPKGAKANSTLNCNQFVDALQTNELFEWGMLDESLYQFFFFCAAGMVDMANGRGQTRSINFPPTRARPNGYPSVGREHLPSLYVAAVVSSISSFLQRIRTAARTSHNRRWGTKRQYAIRRSERN